MSTSSLLCYSQLSGQQKAKKMIGRSITAGRLPHALIFRGPKGVGKKKFALGLAAAVNCRDKSCLGACGSCISCKKFWSKNHPDFKLVRPDKGIIKIDQIRSMSRELEYAPYESTTRVIVLEDVHTMRREAANSLLKTLEEPPVNNLLILTADSSQEILATLTSRCQIIPFVSLSTTETTDILVQLGIDRVTAQVFARLSEGSPGMSMLLHKKNMLDLAREVVGAVADPGITGDRDVSVLLLLAEKMAALKEDLPTLLGLFRLWIKDLLTGAEQDGCLLPAEERVLKSWNSAELFAKLQAIDKAEKELKRNCNKNLVCEVLLFRLQ